MSDDLPSGRRQPPRLTVAQQDRAAGLLVGMAVGESMASVNRAERGPHRYSGEVTDRALVAVEEDQPEPFEYLTWDAWASPLLLTFGYFCGHVPRELGQKPEQFFAWTQKLAEGDGEEMEYGDPQALGEACALWAAMLRHAVLTGEADLRVGLQFLGRGSYQWDRRIRDMERGLDPELDGGGPYDLLHSAWAAVSAADATKRSQRFTMGIESGRYTEGEWLIGPLVGAALGATHGYSAIPWAWRRSLRDARGDSAEHLMRSAVSAALDLEYVPNRWPEFQRVEPPESASPVTMIHPSDPGVLLSGIDALEETQVEAAVSLCNPGAKLRFPRGSSVDHAVFWLVDSDDPQDNPNLDFVLEDAARAILTFRQESKTVLLHGLTGESRTPTVAARYGALISGRPVWDEFQRISRALPHAAPNAGFLRHLASADARPRDLTEDLVAEQASFGHLTVDRQLIELLSWTIAAELLKKDHMDGWVQPMEGPEDGFVVLLGGTRIEFLRAGTGITLNGEPFMSWTQVVTAGGPHLVVARLEAELNLLFKGCVVIQTTTSPWKAEFAAALVRSGFGSTRSVRVQPLPEADEQRDYMHKMFGPRLLCTVDDFSFVVDRRDVIATGMAPLWTAGSGDEGPELAACTVLNRLLESRRDRDE
ncbi:hypothetical protein ACT4S2_07140 [Kocuria turfanensis]|uniref:hypothetical protein n=1 Tax=Kocuria turfanensis TaxID=388357 RepID=UPI004036264D